MKNVLLSFFVVGMALASCTTVTKTATTVDVNNGLNSASTVDLEISSNKISYTHKTKAKERRAGKKNVINSAVSAALQANVGADVLVAPEYVTVKKLGLFGSKIKTVIVTGYPAKYKNFKSQ